MKICCMNLKDIKTRNSLTCKAERSYIMKKTRMLRTYNKSANPYEQVVREYDLNKISTQEFETICAKAERIEFYNEVVFA